LKEPGRKHPRENQGEYFDERGIKKRFLEDHRTRRWKLELLMSLNLS